MQCVPASASKKLQDALAKTARQEVNINTHRHTGFVTYSRMGRITTASVVTSMLSHSQPYSVVQTPGHAYILCLQAAGQLLSTVSGIPS